jgi:CTP:molybdopterin cytidylyltransferase MocA
MEGAQKMKRSLPFSLRVERMGVNKLALPWGRKTVLERCAEVLVRSNIKEVVVVLSDRTKALGSRLRGPKIKLVMNPNYERGMSTSIRGRSSSYRKNDRNMVSNQPVLRTRTINALSGSCQEREIIVPIFPEEKHHLFGPTFAEGAATQGYQPNLASNI